MCVYDKKIQYYILLSIGIYKFFYKIFNNLITSFYIASKQNKNYKLITIG